MIQKFEEGIMGAGKKPKPTALKELEGNPGKRKLNKKEPMPGKRNPTVGRVSTFSKRRGAMMW